MSLVTVAAATIRQAARDENYAQDLQEMVATNPTALEGLVHRPIDESDLRWLSPSDWLWFARWRQGMGGDLDEGVLNHLESWVRSRFARFELRSLVMRDPRTNEAAVGDREAEQSRTPASGG
jgi:hypothetical protein